LTLLSRDYSENNKLFICTQN